ncbi:MAG: sigma-70 family RNA polymerase sigma factor [Bryobacteraceae bacterium]
MNARSEAVASGTGAVPFDLEATFRAHYERIARVIGRVVRDPARAEELAVEVFLKLWRNPAAQGPAMECPAMEAWLYRTAVRAGLDELRRRTRRDRREQLFGFLRPVPDPEQTRSANEQRDRVQAVLAALAPRQAEMLVLRSHGLSYGELASALEINPASIGTLLARAQEAFRKEYVNRYGEQ